MEIWWKGCRDLRKTGQMLHALLLFCTWCCTRSQCSTFACNWMDLESDSLHGNKVGFAKYQQQRCNYCIGKNYSNLGWASGVLKEDLLVWIMRNCFSNAHGGSQDKFPYVQSGRISVHKRCHTAINLPECWIVALMTHNLCTKIVFWSSMPNSQLSAAHSQTEMSVKIEL